MPGSVQNAAPLTVLTASLSRAFVHEREYPVLDNEYRNGESQRSAQASNSRKRWRLSRTEFEANLLSKMDDPAFLADIAPLLSPAAADHFDAHAAEVILEQFISKLPGEPR